RREVPGGEEEIRRIADDAFFARRMDDRRAFVDADAERGEDGVHRRAVVEEGLALDDVGDRLAGAAEEQVNGGRQADVTTRLQAPTDVALAERLPPRVEQLVGD